jgi:hypothetical protein
MLAAADILLSGNMAPYRYMRLSKAAIDLRAALEAQPEQPQEPVGLLNVKRWRGELNYDFEYYENLPDGQYKCYTRPQPLRSLSDDEIFTLAEPYGRFEFGDSQGHRRLAFARAIEAKMKEQK